MKNIKDFINESSDKNDELYDVVSDYIDETIDDMGDWDDSDIKDFISNLYDNLYNIGVDSDDVRELIKYVEDNSNVDTDDDNFTDDLGDALNAKMNSMK